MDEYTLFVLVIGIAIGLYLNVDKFQNQQDQVDKQLAIICDTLDFVSRLKPMSNDIDKIQHQITAYMLKLDNIERESLKPLRKEAIRYLYYVSESLDKKSS